MVPVCANSPHCISRPRISSISCAGWTNSISGTLSTTFGYAPSANTRSPAGRSRSSNRKGPAAGFISNVPPKAALRFPANGSMPIQFGRQRNETTPVHLLLANRRSVTASKPAITMPGQPASKGLPSGRSSSVPSPRACTVSVPSSDCHFWEISFCEKQKNSRSRQFGRTFARRGNARQPLQSRPTQPTDPNPKRQADHDRAAKCRPAAARSVGPLKRLRNSDESAELTNRRKRQFLPLPGLWRNGRQAPARCRLPSSLPCLASAARFVRDASSCCASAAHSPLGCVPLGRPPLHQIRFSPMACSGKETNPSARCAAFYRR